MSQPNPFAAQLLEHGAGGFAGFASALLEERHPDLLASSGTAGPQWRGHLAQSVLELAAAVRTGESELFVARAQWARTAAQAREQPEDGLRASLECLREVLTERLPAPAASAVEPHLDAALDAFAEPACAAVSEIDPHSTTGRLTLRYLETALRGEGRNAVALLLEAVEGGMEPLDIYRHVLMPAQREVGRLWHQGELGISEEHLVTTTTIRSMAVLCQRSEAAPANGKTVVTAAVEGNVHELGVRMVGDMFELAGWRSVCLGADTPVSEVLLAATYFEADLLVLSATMSTQLKAVADTVAAIRGSERPTLPIVVGGPAFEDSPGVWASVGADAFAETADQAVELGTSLVTA